MRATGATQPSFIDNQGMANLQVTLAFVGTADIRWHACLHRQALRVNAQAFWLRLDHLGYFSASRVLWLGPKQPSGALLDLAGALQLNLRECGYAPELRLYRAHLSLYRNVSSLPAVNIDRAIVWQVREFYWVESRQSDIHMIYEKLACYPLNIEV